MSNKIIKLIHCSDIHIRTFKYHDEYKEQFDKFLVSAKKELETIEYNEGRIVIVGDLVHQKITISNELITLASYFLNECSKLAPVILVAGNHDLLENNPDRLDSITPIVKLLDNPNIHYFKERGCYEDNNIVWCNYSIFEGNQRPDIEEARAKYGNDKTYLGLFHAPVIGATTDIGYELDHGANLEHFKGCNAVLLGDIHKRQVFEFEGIKAIFPSSMIQQNYGETVTKHGYTVWDVDTLKDRHVEIPSEAGFFQFKMNSLDDLDNGNYKLTNA